MDTCFAVLALFSTARSWCFFFSVNRAKDRVFILLKYNRYYDRINNKSNLDVTRLAKINAKMMLAAWAPLVLIIFFTLGDSDIIKCHSWRWSLFILLQLKFHLFQSIKVLPFALLTGKNIKSLLCWKSCDTAKHVSIDRHFVSKTQIAKFSCVGDSFSPFFAKIL